MNAGNPQTTKPWIASAQEKMQKALEKLEKVGRKVDLSDLAKMGAINRELKWNHLKASRALEAQNQTSTFCLDLPHSRRLEGDLTLQATTMSALNTSAFDLGFDSFTPASIGGILLEMGDLTSGAEEPDRAVLAEILEPQK